MITTYLQRRLIPTTIRKESLNNHIVIRKVRGGQCEDDGVNVMRLFAGNNLPW